MIDLEKVRQSARYTLTDDGHVVGVITHHEEHAVRLGFEFERAAVVVVCNPEHPVDPNNLMRGTIRRYTITRRHEDVRVDLLAALKEFQTGEPRWSGNADTIQSAPNGSSYYDVQTVLAIVHKHLL